MNNDHIPEKKEQELSYERRGGDRGHRGEHFHGRHGEHSRRGEGRRDEKRGGEGVRGHREGGHRRRRLFDYGELRVLLLAMIKENTAHGYELMRQIEERFDGNYVPSPGVVYPTLSWTEDMGYTNIVAAENGKKQYSLTPEGSAFLEANRQLAEELLTREFNQNEKPKGGRGNPQLRDAFERLRHVVKSAILHQQDEQISERVLNIMNETITRIETEFKTKAEDHE